MKKISLILIIFLSVSGCAGISDFYVSQTLNSHGQYKDWKNGVVKVQLDDIRIYVNPYNHRYARGGVELFFIPLVDEKKEIKGKYSKGSYLYEKEIRYDNDYGVAFHHPVEGDYFYVAEYFSEFDLKPVA